MMKNLRFEIEIGTSATKSPGIVQRCEIHRYSTDDNAVRLVRDRIAELNIRDRFVEALYTLVQEPGSDFNILQATPRQQCIAALEAVKVRIPTPDELEAKQ